jgi:hypothetical protein
MTRWPASALGGGRAPNAGGGVPSAPRGAARPGTGAGARAFSIMCVGVTCQREYEIERGERWKLGIMRVDLTPRAVYVYSCTRRACCVAVSVVESMCVVERRVSYEVCVCMCGVRRPAATRPRRRHDTRSTKQSSGAARPGDRRRLLTCMRLF